MMGEITEVTEDQLNQLKQDGGLIALMFCADWCGPCKQQLRFLTQVQNSSEGQGVAFVKADIDAEPMLCAAMKVRSLPTVVIFKGNLEMARLNGLMEAESIKQVIHVARRT